MQQLLMIGTRILIIALADEMLVQKRNQILNVFITGLGNPRFQRFSPRFLVLVTVQVGQFLEIEAGLGHHFPEADGVLTNRPLLLELTFENRPQSALSRQHAFQPLHFVLFRFDG